MERKEMNKINIAAKLRNCPSGLPLMSPCFDGLVFDRIDCKGRIRCMAGTDEVSFNQYGCLNDSPSARCVIFPDGTNWDDFVVSQYPRTYEECLKIVGDIYSDSDVVGYRWELLTQFQRLLVCRDAYWKIAGEEMGLGKPWEPVWDNMDNKFTINNWVHGLHFGITCTVQNILAFPTEEMRDAFYDNFKPLINGCKELL